MTEHRTIITETLIWQGITIELTYEPDWLNMGDMPPSYATAHLTVRSVKPENAQLPFTETGYRSHFTSPELIADAGGPSAFVNAWLEHAAQSPEWRLFQEKSRQLSLF